jgi:hypothetical protein
VIVENAQNNGGQAHFYMEPQGCIAEPIDQRRFAIYPSTQSPMEMHQTSAMALGVHYNQVEIHVSFVGGGFPVGTVFAKLLFTDAPQGNDHLPFLENPLQWTAFTTPTFFPTNSQPVQRVVGKVNLLQMDIAVRDAHA